MAILEQRKREVVTRTDDGVDAGTRVVTSSARGEPAVNVLARVIYFLTSVVVGLLTLRFILSLLGANRNNGFADLIYSASQPFASPFLGLFNYQAQYGVSRFEFETLVAIIVYILLAWLLIALIELGGRRTET